MNGHARVLRTALQAFGVLAALACGGAAAAEPAIWDRYPLMICRATTMQFCTAAGCEQREPTAVFVVNFAAGTIKAAVSREPARILSKQVFPTLGFAQVITDSGANFAFSQQAIDRFGSPVVAAVKVSAALPSSDSMWLDCLPQ